MQILLIILTVGLPVGIPIGFLLYFSRMSSGVWPWTYIYIKISGKKSTAVIVDSIDKVTNISVNKSPQYMFTVVLDVEDPNSGIKYRVKRKFLDSWYSVLKQKNAELPVIIHPTNSEIVILNRREIRKQRNQQLKQMEESEEQRLNRLMNT